jgi:hypothetical protein
MAGELIEMVLNRYQDERKQLGQRVVVQKTSRFEAAEAAGFDQTLLSVKQGGADRDGDTEDLPGHLPQKPTPLVSRQAVDLGTE